MSSRKEKIILIVEAGQTALSTRKLILETAGYNVISAVRAEQALRFAEAYEFDFIIFDVDVRDLDPAETVRKLRRRLLDAPFYLLAPGPWPPEHLKGAVDGVFVKMEDPQKMIELINRYFEEHDRPELAG